ncbi:SAM-dependent methyltransferase [Streptomyces angustmyceticus]|uniref:SAM-dependent methyltransferase n=1 Tax=Streptomyces angustmyceticus TaxID=285578 RepID=UPI003D904C54
MTQNDEISLAGVSETALWTAQMRAGESRKPHALFSDPWAGRFVAAAGEFHGPPGAGAFQVLLPEWLAVRTRFFDDHLMARAGAGCRQVVLLGAGLDTRALRLDWPAGTRLYEVDLPAVHAFKEAVLADGAPAAAERVAVRADLQGPWSEALIAAGFDPAEPTAWLCEGLLYYLEPEVVAELVATVSGLSAPGSSLGAECLNAETAHSSFMRPWLEDMAAAGTPWPWRLRDPEDWWGRHGWSADVTDPWSLPYVVERMGAFRNLLQGGEELSMLLVTGMRK